MLLFGHQQQHQHRHCLVNRTHTHTVCIDRDREKTSVCVSMRRKAKAAKNCVHRKTNRWRIKPTCRQAAAVSRRRSRCRQSSSTFGRRRQALHCYSTIWCQAIGRQAGRQQCSLVSRRGSNHQRGSLSAQHSIPATALECWW